MRIDQQREQLCWEGLDPSWSMVDRDWHGQSVAVPATFALAMDPTHLWFVAAREKRASISPYAAPCQFAEALWRYDVAELFIKDAHSDRYLEFNLAPNGAWWSAEFTGPRVRADNEDIPIVGVRTYAKISGDGCWQAAASIPLSFLESDFSFGQGSRINVTFIVDSPEQKFLSVAALRGAKPDFHQPHCFDVVELNA